MLRTSILCAVLFASGCCSDKNDQETPPVTKTPQTTTPTTPVTTNPTTPATTATLAPRSIPPDGKYENVRVVGVTVPMINIMEGGTVVLVDTDGVKPRSWEEQYKRKGKLPSGYFDIHKRDSNRNDKFDDEPVEQGRWKMDDKGTLERD